jgi:multicomponent K+:H+ antiporter subunit A
VGIFPALTYGPLVHAAAGALLGTAPPDYHLAIWHGFNLPLLMSAIAVVAGTALYFILHKSFRLPGYTPRRWSGRASFTCLMDGLFTLAGRVTHRVENGSLQRSLAVIVLLVLIMAAAPFGSADSLPEAGHRALLPAPPLAIVLWVLLLAAGAALVRTHHARFQAVVLTGVVGLVTALTFVALSAPDLALTQLSVEVVSTVLLLMGLALLPQTSPRESSALRYGRDGALALAAGAGVAALAWLMLTRDHASISWFFLDNTVPGGGGTNAVNVILVDFRGYDTFGEITVLGIAALGALALLDGLRVKRPTVDAAGRSWSFEQQPLLLRVAARIVLPLALVVSAYIFWRGHNLPGGGFIAGLITATALVMQYLANGVAWTNARLPAHTHPLIAAGLTAAFLTGIASWLFGRPFLTSAFGHFELQLIGEIELASAMFFDLGVYLVVVGAALLILINLGIARGASHDGGKA